MKKLFNLALVGTMVLTAVACQREQVGSSSSVDANGNDVKEVATQFVLNVASAPQTKMSADVVQQNHNFRGIQDVKLFVYKTGISNASEIENPTDANTNKPYIVTTTAPAEGKVKEFDLGYFMSPTAISNAGDDNKENSSNRVLQLSIPVGVDAVMLYGKAIRGENASLNATHGVTLDYNPHDATKKKTISSTPSKTQFHALSILNDNKRNEYDATGRLMIYIINDILSSFVPDGGSVEVGTGDTKKVFSNLPPLSWAQLGHTYEINTMAGNSRYDAEDSSVEKMPSTSTTTYSYTLDGLEEILGKCYYLFTYIKPKEAIPSGQTEAQFAEWVKEHRKFGEYRGGSSFAIKKIIVDFYKIITAASEAEPTTDKEANAQRLAKQILKIADLYIDNSNGMFDTVSEIKSYLSSVNLWNETSFGGANDLNNYPFGDFGIPDGAAQLAFTPQSSSQLKDAFSYLDPNYPLVNPNMQEFNPKKYLFPAELWYYVNSPIRTNESDIAVADFPNGVNQWNATSSWEADAAKKIKAWTPNGAVASATKAIAVTNNVNYGVALLKSEVVIGSGVSELLDNRAEMTDETTPRRIKVADSHIAWNGILIGGVNPRMNWQFTRYYTVAGQPGESAGLGIDEGDLTLFDGVIYDHATGETAPEISKNTTVNYTLVYDNYVSNAPGSGQTVADMQNDVYVSLEFINNGDAFWGRDNLIPQGGTFYLVGRLPKPTADQIIDLEWPSDHQIPPLYGIDGEEVPTGHFAGESKKVARVFIQDFVTKAKFTLGETALKHAYYSVPDLRASQMSLGLSVDLEWNSGLTYNIDL